jgi:CHAT domain-containing protein
MPREDRMSQPNLLFLEIFREQDKIKVSAQEGAELQVHTLHHYEYKKIDWTSLYAICGELFQVLNAYNRDGRLANRSLDELKRLGGVLLDELFPPQTKEHLLGSDAKDMVVRIDNGLVQIPWELLYDGQRFFCRRWNMGRLVRTRQKLYKTSLPELTLPLRMMLIADPRGDLHAAYREGQLIRDLLDTESGKIETDLLSYRVETGAAKGRLKDCTMLHYAGHADYISEDPSQSGLLMKDGKLTAAEITEMSGGRGVPSLVFVNGCRSGQTEEWRLRRDRSSQEIFGLANAFLLAGARHYVGTFWEVQDEPSSRVAMHFYKELAAGSQVGASLRRAREAIIEDFGESAIVWATYMLYGDPSFAYVREQAAKEGEERREQSSITHDLVGDHGEATAVRGGTAEIADQDAASLNRPLPSASGRETRRSLLTAGLVSVIVVLFLLGGLHLYRHMKDVREISSLLSRSEEDLYGKGDTRSLLVGYANALESGNATETQLATLHGRLGRIYASKGDMKEAVEHYEQALASDPDDRTVQSDLCLALNRQGRYEEASQCLEGLLVMDPQDEIALFMHRQIEERLALEADKSRRMRVDALIDRLSKRGESQAEGPESRVEDGWTSRPLALAILTLEDQGGLSHRAGETEAMLQKILQRLNDSDRVRIVDRFLLERALEELDLGSGVLADAAFSLRVGRILSARLIGHGSVYRDKESLQVNLRFIETETTSLKVALTETFPRDVRIEDAGNLLAETILGEISTNYPLRGEVVSIDASGRIILNIGSQVGLEENSLLNVLPPGKEDPRIVLARLRVISVKRDHAEAEVLDHPDQVNPGCRVLETAKSAK